MMRISVSESIVDLSYDLFKLAFSLPFNAIEKRTYTRLTKADLHFARTLRTYS